jgi:hypothetical protein
LQSNGLLYCLHMNNSFNKPDREHIDYFSFKPMLDDIVEIYKHGLVFNGRFKRVYYGKRLCIKYYVAMSCGHASYRTMHSIKGSSTTLCGDCTKSNNHKEICRNKYNNHKKKIEFYESILDKGCKLLSLNRSKNRGVSYYVNFTCMCGRDGKVRVADLNRAHREKRILQHQIT